MGDLRVRSNSLELAEEGSCDGEATRRSKSLDDCSTVESNSTIASEALLSSVSDRTDSISELSAAATPPSDQNSNERRGFGDDNPPAADRCQCHGRSTGGEHPSLIDGTTVVLNNLPDRMKEKDLDVLLRYAGLQYSYIYMPLRFRGHNKVCNRGYYAFVGLNSVCDMEWCCSLFDGLPHAAGSTTRISAVVARAPGLGMPSRAARGLPPSCGADAGAAVEQNSTAIARSIACVVASLGSSAEPTRPGGALFS